MHSTPQYHIHNSYIGDIKQMREQHIQHYKKDIYTNDTHQCLTRGVSQSHEFMVYMIFIWLKKGLMVSVSVEYDSHNIKAWDNQHRIC